MGIEAAAAVEIALLMKPVPFCCTESSLLARIVVFSGVELSCLFSCVFLPGGGIAALDNFVPCILAVPFERLIG